MFVGGAESILKCRLKFNCVAQHQTDSSCSHDLVFWISALCTTKPQMFIFMMFALRFKWQDRSGLMLLFVSTLPQITYCMCGLSLLPTNEPPNRVELSLYFLLYILKYPRHLDLLLSVISDQMDATYISGKNRSGVILHNYYIFFTLFICFISPSVFLMLPDFNQWPIVRINEIMYDWG